MAHPPVPSLYPRCKNAKTRQRVCDFSTKYVRKGIVVKKMRIFKSTFNTRPVIENSLKYIRTDLPLTISESELEWLITNRITTVIDLRSDGERLQKPCPLSTDPRFDYHAISLTGGEKIPATPADVPLSYIGMVDDKFYRALDILLTAENGVLYFCTAGKDRTGTLTAALLFELGFPRDYIVTDYMKSRESLLPLVPAFLAANPTVDVNVITPHPEYITGFLDWYTVNKRS